MDKTSLNASSAHARVMNDPNMGVPAGTIGAGVNTEPGSAVSIPVHGVGYSEDGAGYNPDGLKSGTPSNAPKKTSYRKA